MLPPPQRHPESTVNGCTAAAGAGDISLAAEANGAVGVAVAFVHARSCCQLATAWAAAAPVRGWGRSSTMTAGRHVTWSICRPVTVITRDPLAFSGGELS